MAAENTRQKKTQSAVEKQLTEQRLWLDNAKQAYAEQPAVVCDSADGKRQIENLRVCTHFSDETLLYIILYTYVTYVLLSWQEIGCHELNSSASQVNVTIKYVRHVVRDDVSHQYDTELLATQFAAALQCYCGCFSVSDSNLLSLIRPKTFFNKKQ